MKPGDVFSFVRLLDRKSGCTGNWPGADIDAIGAISSVVPGQEPPIVARNGYLAVVGRGPALPVHHKSAIGSDRRRPQHDRRDTNLARETAGQMCLENGQKVSFAGQRCDLQLHRPGSAR